MPTHICDCACALCLFVLVHALTSALGSPHHRPTWCSNHDNPRLFGALLFPCMTTYCSWCVPTWGHQMLFCFSTPCPYSGHAPTQASPLLFCLAVCPPTWDCLLLSMLNNTGCLVFLCQTTTRCYQHAPTQACLELLCFGAHLPTGPPQFSWYLSNWAYPVLYECRRVEPAPRGVNPG